MGNNEKRKKGIVEIRICYTDQEVHNAGLVETSLRLHWWNGTAWVACSDTGVNTTANYIWAIINPTTVPNLHGLTALPFAAAGYLPPVGGITLSVDKLTLMGPTSLAIIAISLVAIPLLLRRRQP